MIKSLKVTFIFKTIFYIVITFIIAVKNKNLVEYKSRNMSLESSSQAFISV